MKTSTGSMGPVTLKRFTEPGSLYTPFAIPTSLSYACTAPPYNKYTGTGSDGNVTVLLGGIKVSVSKSILLVLVPAI